MRDDGVELSLSNIITDLGENHFIKKSAEENEQVILAADPRIYAIKSTNDIESELLSAIQTFVSERFTDTRISVSMLNNFFDCPWKWYFRNFLRLPEAKSVSLSLGSAVHSTIEYILKAKVLPKEADIKQYLTQCLKHEGVTDPKELDLFSRFSKLKDNNNKPPQNIDNDELLERLNRLKSSDFPPTPPSSQKKQKKREVEMETSTEEELNKLWEEFNLGELNNNIDWSQTDSSDFSDPFDIISYTLG